MEELQQLINLIEDKRHLPGSPLINFNDEDSLEMKLYNFIKNNKAFEDNEAIQHLYNTASKKDAFKMLKSRFKKKLYNQLHFLKHDNFSEIVSAEFSSKKLLMEADILYRSEEYALAEKRVSIALKLAKQFFLTNEVVQGIELYQNLLVNGYYNKLKYDQCELELKQYYRILVYEREATSYYNEVIININSGIDSRQIISTKIPEILLKLEALWKKSESPKIFKQYYKVKLGYLELSGNFIEQIEFIKFINNIYAEGVINPLYFNLSFSKFILSYACLRASRYEEGLIAASEALALTEKNTYNWFAILENYFLLNLHTLNYIESYKIAEDVLANSFFHKLDQVVQERWLLFADFQKLLSAAKSDIKYHDVFIISKDKKGYNTWLIILDFLKFLKQGKHELLYREGERIRKYVSKHLDSKADPRYKLFLKLLVLVVKQDFDLIKIKQKSRYLYTKLSETNPAGDAYAEVEIVPFEHLWEFVLENLKVQKVKAA